MRTDGGWHQDLMAAVASHGGGGGEKGSGGGGGKGTASERGGGDVRGLWRGDGYYGDDTAMIQR